VVGGNDSTEFARHKFAFKRLLKAFKIIVGLERAKMNALFQPTRRSNMSLAYPLGHRVGWYVAAQDNCSVGFLIRPEAPRFVKASDEMDYARRMKSSPVFDKNIR
jgi:hypothetical protein